MQMMDVLQQIRTEVEKTCDYVGDDFAEEARKIRQKGLRVWKAWKKTLSTPSPTPERPSP